MKNSKSLLKICTTTTVSKELTVIKVFQFSTNTLLPNLALFYETFCRCHGQVLYRCKKSENVTRLISRSKRKAKKRPTFEETHGSNLDNINRLYAFQINTLKSHYLTERFVKWWYSRYRTFYKM